MFTLVKYAGNICKLVLTFSVEQYTYYILQVCTKVSTYAPWRPISQNKSKQFYRKCIV